MKVCESVPCGDDDYDEAINYSLSPETTEESEVTIFPATSENYNVIDDIRENCSSGQLEYLEHESNCSLYYHCNHGAPVIKSCLSPTLFNPEQLNCDWPGNVLRVRPSCQLDISAEIFTATPTPSEEDRREGEEGGEPPSIVIVQSSRTPPGHCDTEKYIQAGQDLLQINIFSF